MILASLKNKKSGPGIITISMQVSRVREEKITDLKTRKVIMSIADSTINQTEREFIDKSLSAESPETLSTESTGPYSLMLVGVESSVKSLDDSKEQIKKLVNTLEQSANPKNQELIIRATKELRELLKVKLDYGKFAHAVGGDKRKVSKETA